MSPGSGSRVLVLSAMRPFTCNGQIALYMFLHMQYVGRNGTAAAWALFSDAPVSTCAENSDRFRQYYRELNIFPRYVDT